MIDPFYSPFKNKDILFMSIRFFNYENLIKEELQSLGANVDWFDERPSNSLYTKAAIRVSRKSVEPNIVNYFNKLIETIKHKQYDYFLLIKGETTPKFFLDFLKYSNPKIQLIFYTWDSFANNSAGLSILNCFDRKFTFDRDDAKKYNISFRPLFFSKNYEILSENKLGARNTYDLSFIGTAHSDRYTVSEKIKIECNKKSLSMFTFYYSPSKVLFELKKIFVNDFRFFDRNKISFESLSHQQIINLFQNSKSILDINHPNQKGLTMRTFEALGANCKLVTTNYEIKTYPFYNTSNILVIDRNNPKIEEDFFKTPFVKIQENLFNAMSLRGWCFEIFGFTKAIKW